MESISNEIIDDAIRDMEQQIYNMASDLNCFKQALEFADEVVIVCGRTGTGKSTLLNILLEKNMIDFLITRHFNDDFDDGLNEPEQQAHIKITSKANAIFKIGEKLAITTTKPTWFLEYRYLFIDLPDIYDTCNFKTTMMRIYSTQAILALIQGENKEKSKPTKIIFCESCSSVTENNGATFVDNFGRIMNWLFNFEHNYEAIITNLALVFTKPSIGDSLSTFK